MEHFDISNNQEQLFNNVYRSYTLDGIQGMPIEKGLRIKNYTDLIDLRSDVNYPNEYYSQLDGNSVIGTFGKANSQSSKLPQPTINCTPRHNPEAYRFNYGIDGQIDNRMIDTSGVEIPNKFLRLIPNSGTQLAYQKPIEIQNKQINKLVDDIVNISYKPADNKEKLKFKASRQRLSRAELVGATDITKPVPRPVYSVPAPP